MTYIVFVTYDNDAERKRIEYLLDKWSKRAEVKKPKGILFFIDVAEEDEFFEELFSKIEGDPESKVEVYEVRRVKSRIPKKCRTIEYRFQDEVDVVEKFLRYLLSKIGATKVGGEEDRYEVFTRKGKALITLRVEEKGNSTLATIRLEGFGDVVDYLAGKLNSELKIFAGGEDGNL